MDISNTLPARALHSLRDSGKTRRLGLAPALLVCALLFTACDDFNRPLEPWIEDQYEKMRKVKAIAVTPQNAQVSKGFTRQFTAEVNVRAETPRDVTWRVTYPDGSPTASAISPSGVLSADDADLGFTLIVTATSCFDPSKSASSAVTVCNPVTVTFHLSAQSLSPFQNDINIGGSVSRPLDPAPAPSGFIFDGWYTAASGGSRVVFPYTPGNTTLYARWKYNAAVTAATWAAAINAAKSASPGSFIIDIGGNSFSLSSSGGADNPALTGATGLNLAITGSGTISLAAGVTGKLLDIPANVTVTLDGPALRGHTSNNTALVSAGGEFTLKNGAVKDNRSTGNGGGVIVTSSGAFIMSGGIISGNIASGGGGGVCIDGGSFTMTGGTISGNSANLGGAVRTSSSGSAFAMTGGVIRGNSATWGGGAEINSGTTFTMTGGTITGNTVSNNSSSTGGGVSTAANSTFTMSGGTITGNTAPASNPGGGVFLNGSFILNSPARQSNVSGNTPDQVHKDAGTISGSANPPSSGW